MSSNFTPTLTSDLFQSVLNPLREATQSLSILDTLVKRLRPFGQDAELQSMRQALASTHKLLDEALTIADNLRVEGLSVSIAHVVCQLVTTSIRIHEASFDEDASEEALAKTEADFEQFYKLNQAEATDKAFAELGRAEDKHLRTLVDMLLLSHYNETQDLARQIEKDLLISPRT